MTKWAISWERSGWTTALGAQVVSKDAFKRARDLIKSLAGRGVFIKLQYVLGHKGIVGNEEADKLAVEGAKKKNVLLEKDNFEDQELDEMIAEMGDIY